MASLTTAFSYTYYVLTMASCTPRGVLLHSIKFQVSESRNKLSEEGYWKEFHNYQLISKKQAVTLF